MAKTARNGEKEPDSFGNQDEILLGVLTVVERDANTSQRGISRELDVALGLANAYLKRCVRKGLIKIKQVPRRRYAYYLTPRGFAEKSRLAGRVFFRLFYFLSPRPRPNVGAYGRLRSVSAGAGSPLPAFRSWRKSG